jgi:O-antigen/teichoic acid export membrane protein
MVILPRITVAQKDPDAERHLVRRWLLLSAVLIASAVAFLELIAGWAIRVTFGPEFVGATACTRWLLLASGILDFRKVLIAILQGRNLGGRASVIELGLTPVVIVGIVIASARDSLVGVSLAMGAVGVVGCVLLGIAVARSGPGSRARYVPLHSHERQRPA